MTRDLKPYANCARVKPMHRAATARVAAGLSNGWATDQRLEIVQCVASVATAHEGLHDRFGVVSQGFTITGVVVICAGGCRAIGISAAIAHSQRSSLELNAPRSSTAPAASRCGGLSTRMSHDGAGAGVRRSTIPPDSRLKSHLQIS